MARYRKTEAQREYHQAKTCLRNVLWLNFNSILERFPQNEINLESQLAIVWNEDTCSHSDHIAHEDNSYIATWNERERYEKNGKFAMNAQGRIDTFLVCSRIISKRIRSCCIPCTLFSTNRPAHSRNVFLPSHAAVTQRSTRQPKAWLCQLVLHAESCRTRIPGLGKAFGRPEACFRRELRCRGGNWRHKFSLNDFCKRKRNPLASSTNDSTEPRRRGLPEKRTPEGLP